MFDKGTFKTKTFWIGLIQITAGVVLCKVGMVDTGVALIGLGATALGIRDAITKAAGK